MDQYWLAANSKGEGAPLLTPPDISDDDPLHSVRTSAMDSRKGSGVATLAPYIPLGGTKAPKPLPQRNWRKAHNQNCNGMETFPGVFEDPVSYGKYLTFKLAEDKRAQELDMFDANREIIEACGREPDIIVQSDGTLLIEAISSEESRKLQALSLLNGNNAKCYPHKTLNQCKGVIRSTALLKYSEERLQSEFASQKVIEVRQMKKKVNGELTPLPVYVLTFDLLQLPPKIKAAWLRLEVRPFVPSPRRCFYCQRFGHVSNNCRRKIKGEKSICSNCGQEEHGICCNTPSCVNCAECHPASSKKCDRFIMEREIQALRTRERISFVEAKQKVSDQFIRPGITFASIVEKGRKTSTKARITPAGKILSIPSTEVLPKRNVTNTVLKRRLSGEEQLQPLPKIQSILNSKSNKFELLNDEADMSLPSEDAALKAMPSDPVDEGSHSTTVPVTVQAVVHVSASPVEQAETPPSPLTSEERDLSICGHPSTSAEGEDFSLPDPMEEGDTSPAALSFTKNKDGANSKESIRNKGKETSTKPSEKETGGGLPIRNRKIKISGKNEQEPRKHHGTHGLQSNSGKTSEQRVFKSKK